MLSLRGQLAKIGSDWVVVMALPLSVKHTSRCRGRCSVPTASVHIHFLCTCTASNFSTAASLSRSRLNWWRWSVGQRCGSSAGHCTFAFASLFPLVCLVWFPCLNRLLSQLFVSSCHVQIVCRARCSRVTRVTLMSCYTTFLSPSAT